MASDANDNNPRISQSPGLTYNYDNDGNQIGRSDGASFTYNTDNRLVAYTKGSTTATYVYDPFGRRIAKTVNGSTTHYLWDGSQLLTEYSGSTRQLRYASLPNELGPRQLQDNNGTYDIHTDHLQTPRLLTNSSQAVVWSAKQAAFREMQINADVDGDGHAITLNTRFPGQYYDQESGLHYNYYRDYDPTLGRYIESDPIGLAGGLNRYVYVRANSVNSVDPAGLIRVVCGTAAQRDFEDEHGNNMKECVHECTCTDDNGNTRRAQWREIFDNSGVGASCRGNYFEAATGLHGEGGFETDTNDWRNIFRGRGYHDAAAAVEQQ